MRMSSQANYLFVVFQLHVMMSLQISVEDRPSRWILLQLSVTADSSLQPCSMHNAFEQVTEYPICLQEVVPCTPQSQCAQRCGCHASARLSAYLEDWTVRVSACSLCPSCQVEFHPQQAHFILTVCCCAGASVSCSTCSFSRTSRVGYHVQLLGVQPRRRRTLLPITALIP